MLQYHAENPFRPPNWRWERARLIREGAFRGLSRKKEDEWTLTALKFQQSLNKCRNASDRHLLMEKNPGIYFAWMAHTPLNEEGVGTPLRYAIEARLLAGETVDKVAINLGCGPSTIHWYERLFFNVIEKLQHSDYIMTCVISPSLHTGLAPQEYDVLWKVFAYLYGPIVLDALLQGVSAKHRAETAEEADIKISGDIQASIRKKAAIAARTYTLNNFTQEGLMNIYARFLELEKAADSGTAKDTFLSTVNVVLSSLPFADGEGAIRPDQIGSDRQLLKVDHPLLEHYDRTNAELRTDELLAVTTGRELSNRADLEDIKFPEPPDATSPAKTN
jgi:hypothetical protein